MFFKVNPKMMVGFLLISFPHNAFAHDVDAPEPKKDPNTCVVTIKEDAEKSYVQQKVISIPDQELNHDIRLGQTVQRMKDTKLCNGDLLVLKHAYFMQDAHGLDGEGRGYNIYVTDKGDQIVVQTSSIAKYKDGDAPVSHKETTGQVISGSGPYKNVKGAYKSISEENRFKNTTATIEQTLTIIFPSEEQTVASK